VEEIMTQREMQLKLERARSRHREGHPTPQPPAPEQPPARVDLHSDLQRHRTRTPFGERLISHPLLVAPDDERQYRQYNATYVERRDEFHLAMALDSWDFALDLLQHPHSWRFLWDHREKFTPESYWQHLGRLWTFADAFWPVEEKFATMLGHYPEHRNLFMNDWERKFLDSLPPLLRVYRGYVWGDWRGWSWTLLPSVAQVFAHRFDETIRQAQESKWPFTDEDEYEYESEDEDDDESGEARGWASSPAW
jgi:hypothetical protein